MPSGLKSAGGWLASVPNSLEKTISSWHPNTSCLLELRGRRLMTAQDYSQLAAYFLNLAREIPNRKDKAAMLGIATFWMEKAEEAEGGKPVIQQPKKEPHY